MAEQAQVRKIPDYKNIQTQMAIMAKFNEEKQIKINSMLSYINENGLTSNIDLFYMILGNIALINPEVKPRAEAIDYFVPKKKFFSKGYYSVLSKMLTGDVEFAKMIYKVSNYLVCHLTNPYETINELSRDKVIATQQNAHVEWRSDEIKMLLQATLNLIAKNNEFDLAKRFIYDGYNFVDVINALPKERNEIYFNEITDIKSNELITKAEDNKKLILAEVAINLKFYPGRNKVGYTFVGSVELSRLITEESFKTNLNRIDELAQNLGIVLPFYDWANRTEVYVANPVNTTRDISSFLNKYTDKTLDNVLAFVSANLNGKKAITDNDVKIILSKYESKILEHTDEAKSEQLERDVLAL